MSEILPRVLPYLAAVLRQPVEAIEAVPGEVLLSLYEGQLVSVYEAYRQWWMDTRQYAKNETSASVTFAQIIYGNGSTSNVYLAFYRPALRESKIVHKGNAFSRFSSQGSSAALWFLTHLKQILEHERQYPKWYGQEREACLTFFELAADHCAKLVLDHNLASSA